MKLLNAVFQKVNLTQEQARRSLTISDKASEELASLCEMPLRDVTGETIDELTEEFTNAFEEHAINLYTRSESEPVKLPGIEMGLIHTFEITADLNNGAKHHLPHYVTMRGFVEGQLDDPCAKFHITASLSYRLDIEGKARSVYSALYGCESTTKSRTLRTLDGVFAATVLSENDSDVVPVDTRSTFYTGATIFDSREVGGAYYLAKMVNAILAIPTDCDVDINDYLTPEEIVETHLTNGHERQLVERLRRNNLAGHRTMILERRELDSLLDESAVTAGLALADASNGLKSVAHAWDNSVEASAAYDIMQYLHGGLEHKGITTLTLEIDSDGPIEPKFTTVKGFDNGPHTYCDIIKVAEDMHDHFRRNGLFVECDIDFNVNGISTVTLSVDGGAKCTFEYASFASVYCNPLITKNSDSLNSLATAYSALYSALV